MVDLSGHLSNPPSSLVRMLSGAKAQVTGGITTSTRQIHRQKQVHISRHTQIELVARYQAGALQRELAEIYSIHRTTVSAIIRKYGTVRQKGLNQTQVDDAIKRYEAGQSLAVIGRALEVDQGTVRDYLLKNGVQMRDTHGRERA